MKTIYDEKSEYSYMPNCTDEWLELICDIAVGYDGCETAESLKGLIDEMVEYAMNARKCMRERKLYSNNYLKLKSGDDIYYADRENNEVEHGKIFSVAIKDGKVDSFSVDFDCGDFDEFNGNALGKYYFIKEEEARNALMNYN